MIDCTGLLGLQGFDLEGDELDERIKRIQEKALRMAAEIQKSQDMLEKKTALLKKIQVRKKSLENDLENLTDKLKTCELRMKTAGITPITYVALEKELAGSKSRISEVETLLLEDMQKVETLEKDNAKQAKVIAGLRLQLEEVKKRQAGEVQDLSQAKSLVKDKRQMAAMNIPGDILQVYEELRAEKKGRVIWDTETPGCPACGFSMPAGFINPLVGANGALPCPYCGALLRWTGILDGIR